MEQATTLTTFLLQTVPTIRSVELLGSWDNFAKRYPMEKDVRRGRGSWRGCHSFEDITYEGPDRSMAKKRAGGLRMGGTYWYFYVLDGDMEFHNPSEPSTTGCPLLPGQSLNVLDVPVELAPEQSRYRSQSATDVNKTETVARTMNPADKFVNPRAPPAPRRPRLGSAPASLLRLFGRSTRATSLSSFDSNAQPPNFTPPSAAATLSRLLLPPRRSSLPESVPQRSAEAVRVRKSPDMCVKKRSTVISQSSSRRLSTNRQPTDVPEQREPAAADLIGAEIGYLPAAFNTELGSDQHTVVKSSDVKQDHRAIVFVDTEEAIATTSNDSVPSNSWNASEAAPVTSEPPDQHQSPSLFPLDHNTNPPSPPVLRPQIPPRWDSFSLAVDQPVTSHFSLWSTPSVRSISSRSSSDVPESSSPGLTNSDSYTSPLSQGTPSGAISPFQTDMFEDCLPDLSLNHASLSSEGFQQKPSCLENHPQNSLHSLCIRNDWIHDAPSAWKSSGGGFEGYGLPEHQHESETTIRKLTSSGLPPPLMDLPSSKRTSLDHPEGHEVDVHDDLAYLGDVII
ncbi:MAG: hypothetical protein M1823_001109 [Watsoniomyces obsoletus]|nr:MAG: hypothetical protein M1823_001109 [Watsoniomyces obsoletus]